MKPNLQLNTSPEWSRRTYNILSTFLFYLSILFFIIGFNFSDNPAGSWYQQFMPDLGGRSVTDVFFLDSLTGWAVTNATNQFNDTMYVLKTTNSGDNWAIQYRKLQTGGGFPGYFRVYFLNQNTGFVCFTTGFEKTTNGGANWTSLNAPSNSYPDMSILNEDSIWLASGDGLTGGVFRTTDGGASWDRQLQLGSQNPNHVYMYNGRLGFICRDNQYLRRTSDGGQNWSAISGAGGFLDMYFVDSLTGWKTSMQKTTDGGLNWVNQTLPSGGLISSFSNMDDFSNVNRDTIWGAGGFLNYGGGRFRGIIYKTTNGGDNWGFQLPDTSINIAVYSYADFVDKLNGWAWTNGIPGVHTVTGGDTVFYTGIQEMPNAVPEGFVLKQNYPNPFNPRTVIPYSLSAPAHVKIIAYDITGKEVQKMVDNYQQAGAYEVDFMGKFTATGVYFYRMTVTDKKSNWIYTDTKKMILLK
jgi:photosystem II stability/assembly factor-like uncharacterized protein